MFNRSQLCKQQPLPVFTEMKIKKPFPPLMGMLVPNPVSITIDGSICDSLAYSEDIKRRAKKFLQFETIFWISQELILKNKKLIAVKC